MSALGEKIVDIFPLLGQIFIDLPLATSKILFTFLKAPRTLLIFWHVIQTGENTHYAESAWHSSVIAPRILEGIRHNMACTKLGASGPWNLGIRDQ